MKVSEKCISKRYIFPLQYMGGKYVTVLHVNLWQPLHHSNNRDFYSFQASQYLATGALFGTTCPFVIVTLQDIALDL